MVGKSIVLVSNYYPPERGAAPNRIQVLANALQTHGYEVHVVCPLPNYPTGSIFEAFKGKLYLKKIENGITVHRLWIWPSKSSNKFVRLLSMLSFSASLKWFFLLKRIPKNVFVQYSPVFVGFTAVVWGKLLRKKVILNVSDLWPLAGLEMGLLQKGTYYTVLEKMEAYCFKNANLLLGQSNEILSHVKKKGVHTPVFLYRNLPAFTPPTITTTTTKTPIKIVYAGLLGVAQGVSKILQSITIPKHIEFHIYGDGPDAKNIIALKNKQVHYHKTVSREQLHAALQAYDIAFIPLAQRIYGSVPSKVFEYARLGLPLLYMGGGEGSTIVTENSLGYILPVKDYAGLERFLSALDEEKLQKYPKHAVQERAVMAFDFNDQFKRFLQKLEAL